MGRCRVALAVVVLVTTIAKLVVAASTYGTTDVRRWMEFAAGVAQAGPVDVYRLHFRHPHFHHANFHHLIYNHPPLIGYLLLVVNAATSHGVSFPLAIRIPAISADVVTPFLLFELLRRRRSLLEAFVAATSVALSPVLLVISGFHGNTDPVFIMLSLLSVYLLVDRRAPALAGISIAIALGVKIVPVVVVPTLLAFVVRAGWRFALRFILASGALLALTWAPVVLLAWQPFRDHVLGYAGGGDRSWGLAQVAAWMGHPLWVTNLGAPGRFIIVLVVTALPAALALWRPRLVVEASALALTGLLFLTPAFGFQYLVWAAAPAYLLSFWAASAYNLFAGCLLIEVYNRWSGGFPWYLALSGAFTRVENVAIFGIWATLLTVVVAGIRQTMRSRHPPPPGTPPFSWHTTPLNATTDARKGAIKRPTSST
jgi:Dolichyl-phosphate-mannose-protein mannosyltransferase